MFSFGDNDECTRDSDSDWSGLLLLDSDWSGLMLVCDWFVLKLVVDWSLSKSTEVVAVTETRLSDVVNSDFYSYFKVNLSCFNNIFVINNIVFVSLSVLFYQTQIFSDCTISVSVCMSVCFFHYRFLILFVFLSLGLSLCMSLYD